MGYLVSLSTCSDSALSLGRKCGLSHSHRPLEQSRTRSIHVFQRFLSLSPSLPCCAITHRAAAGGWPFQVKFLSQWKQLS